jgi:NADPH:quinone reductase-like Zn-dependent oxidoreductase
MGTQPTIHAAALHAIGQTPRYEPFPAPVAGNGEAVVTVTAAALKPSDRWMANQLAKRQGARVIAAGRNQRVLDQLLERGADAAIRLDRRHEELAAAIVFVP